MSLVSFSDQLQRIAYIDWYYLSGNPNAISILEKNLDKVDWKN